MLMTLGASHSMAASVVAYAECRLMDQIGDTAKKEASTRSAALEILQRIGEGHMDTAKPGLEEQVGFKRGQLHAPEFYNYVVRMCAFKAIGRLDLPEALEYLQNLKPDALAPDTTQQVWPEAQAALRQALMNRVPDEAGKVRLLEDTIREGNPATPWAVQQLCDRGSATSLPLVEDYYRRSYSRRADFDDLYGRCKKQVDVLSRNRDPVEALGSALNLANGFGDPNLLGWTINKLASLNSPRAYAELERYMKEIDSLPDDSPIKAGRGRLYIQRIRDILAARPDVAHPPQ